MFKFQNFIVNIDFLTMIVAFAFFVVLLGFFSSLAYFAIKEILSISGMPRAYNLNDLQPGQTLLTQTRIKGRDVRVVSVTVDRNGLGGGYIFTTDNESLRVPSSSLVLAV